MVADGRVLKGESTEAPVRTTLTFKPPDQDQLIVFIDDNTVERGSRLTIRVHSDWGNGKSTEFPPGKEYRAKTKRDSFVSKKIEATPALMFLLLGA